MLVLPERGYYMIFYLYDWRKVKYEGTTHRKMHPKIALEKSKAKFTINQKEEDIILKHMFPVVLRTIPQIQRIFIGFFSG